MAAHDQSVTDYRAALEAVRAKYPAGPGGVPHDGYIVMYHFNRQRFFPVFIPAEGDPPRYALYSAYRSTLNGELCVFGEGISDCCNLDEIRRDLALHGKAQTKWYHPHTKQPELDAWVYLPGCHGAPALEDAWGIADCESSQE
ncbi:MAG: hypothetical protein HYY25_01110 [Candidatus Wallbacteria bacterium]|nr:hypothetical protein [Candidatus Wallbacteria bacterium]